MVDIIYNNALYAFKDPLEAFYNIGQLTGGFYNGTRLNDFIMHQRALLLSRDTRAVETLVEMLIDYGRFPIDDPYMYDIIFNAKDLSVIYHLLDYGDLIQYINEFMHSRLSYNIIDINVLPQGDTVYQEILPYVMALERSIEKYDRYLGILDQHLFETYEVIETEITDYLSDFRDEPFMPHAKPTDYLIAIWLERRGHPYDSPVDITTIIMDIFRQAIYEFQEYKLSEYLKTGVRVSFMSEQGILFNMFVQHLEFNFGSKVHSIDKFLYKFVDHIVSWFLGDTGINILEYYLEGLCKIQTNGVYTYMLSENEMVAFFQNIFPMMRCTIRDDEARQYKSSKTWNSASSSWEDIKDEFPF